MQFGNGHFYCCTTHKSTLENDMITEPLYDSNQEMNANVTFAEIKCTETEALPLLLQLIFDCSFIQLA